MLKDTISMYYNKVSRSYDTGREASIETFEKVVRLLNIDNESVILDMGCGTGNYTSALQPVSKNVIGIDLSEGMLEQARAKHVNLVYGDITQLPLKSETFDGALAMQVLHHVGEKEQFLSEAHRVLRKQAAVAIHTCSHQQIKTFWLYHYFPRGLVVDLARIPDLQEIISLLEKVGFSDVDIEICYQNIVIDETPERYLDKDYHNSSSTFAFLAEEDIESGCDKIRRESQSGAAIDIVREAEARIAGEVGGSTIIYGRKAG